MGKPALKGDRRTHGKLELQRIEMRKRRRRVEDFLLRGETSRGKIGYALGCSTATVFGDIKAVHERWADEDLKRTKDRRNYRINQTAALLRQCLNSFEISRQSTVQTTTSWSNERCEKCGGTGMMDGSDEWCPVCDGEGTIRVESVVERQVGSAGDVSFLSEARKCVSDAAKLEGLHARKGRPKKEIGLHFHRHAEVNPFMEASAEAIIEVKEAIERLRSSVKERKAIDVESVEETGGGKDG